MSDISVKGVIGAITIILLANFLAYAYPYYINTAKTNEAFTETFSVNNSEIIDSNIEVTITKINSSSNGIYADLIDTNEYDKSEISNVKEGSNVTTKLNGENVTIDVLEVSPSENTTKLTLKFSRTFGLSDSTKIILENLFIVLLIVVFLIIMIIGVAII